MASPMSPASSIRGGFSNVELHRLVKPKLTLHTQQETVFCSNGIVTSKYTLWNFLPKNLFMQFSRTANLYFLIIASMQAIPGLSPTHWMGTVGPLCVVLLVNVVKEISDDYSRHKLDHRFNQTEVIVLRPDGDEKIKWKDVTVGDVLRVMRNEELPADLLLLTTHDRAHRAHVETSNLDGETDWKPKETYGPTDGMHSLAALQVVPQFADGFLETTNPSQGSSGDSRDTMHSFCANYVYNTPTGQGKEPLGATQLLLRGSKLKNVDWALGMAVYTGEESKVMLNTEPPPRKVSQLERHMNWLVVMMFAFMLLVSVGMAFGHMAFLQTSNRWYIYTEGSWPELDEGGARWVVQFVRYLILLNQMIPISLYVTLELVKVAQCVILTYDEKMRYTPSGGGPAFWFKVKTTTLNEELGQVEYVLSDKTGTLTKNQMNLVKCTIGSQEYGGAAAPANQDEASSSSEHTAGLHDNLRLRQVLASGSEPAGTHPTATTAAQQFFRHLALSNGVTRSAVGGEETYQSTSPDEEALVTKAAQLGFVLCERSTDRVKMKVHGVEEAYTALRVLEFTSARKCMSVIVQRDCDGTVLVLSKGADNVMLRKLRDSTDPRALERVQATLHRYATSGLRTLVLTSRALGQSEFASWHKRYVQALTVKRADAAVELMAELESHMDLLGAVAIEDQLQDGAPQAVQTLLQAGIKVWMLTGDKMETAVSIAKTCRLIQPPGAQGRKDGRGSDMSETIGESSGSSLFSSARVEEPLIVFDDEGRDLDKCRQRLEHARDRILHDQALQGIAINGENLTEAMKSADNRSLFLQICRLSRVVICCRVSPQQKALVTEFVKREGGGVTLAVGDGANDVNMIQAAHIGVGVSGREGAQAVMVADFAIGQFRFLARLLLVHGRWSFKRNKEVVLYAFYKNFVYASCNIYLAFVSGFSSQPLYSTAMIATYNVLWTSLPTIAMGVYEEDMPAHQALKDPSVYQDTQQDHRGQFFGSFFLWLVGALMHSLLLFCGVFFGLNSTSALNPMGGRQDGFWAAGTTVYTAVVVVVNLKLAARTKLWMPITHFCFWVWSIGLWFAFVAFLSIGWTEYDVFPELYDVHHVLFKNPSFWFTVILLSAVVLPDVALDALASEMVRRRKQASKQCAC